MVVLWKVLSSSKRILRKSSCEGTSFFVLSQREVLDFVIFFFQGIGEKDYSCKAKKNNNNKQRPQMSGPQLHVSAVFTFDFMSMIK